MQECNYIQILLCKCILDPGQYDEYCKEEDEDTKHCHRQAIHSEAPRINIAMEMKSSIVVITQITQQELTNTVLKMNQISLTLKTIENVYFGLFDHVQIPHDKLFKEEKKFLNEGRSSRHVILVCCQTNNWEHSFDCSPPFLMISTCYILV